MMKASSSLFAVLLATVASTCGAATINVSSPASGTVVTSPFQLSASASECMSQSVVSMGYSMDDSSNTTVVKGTSVVASVTAVEGAHTLHVKSWGPQKAACVVDVAINVTDPAPVSSESSTSSLQVSAPANHSSVTSPFSLQAAAESCSGQAVSAMGYSFDSSTDTTIVKGPALASLVTSASGAHTVHVKAWGNKGAVCVSDVALNVKVPATTATVPADAVSVSSIQALSNWKGVYDTGTMSGNSNGAMAMVGSPARSGNARKFVTTYSNNGGERYWVSFGDDASATNFLYDGWVYLDSSAAQIANLEMDMNQTMTNGQTVIYGIQCDGWTGTWDYTANTGTPKNPVDSWIHSKQPCNVRNWKQNSWHHVQISYSRDQVGNVTYKSIWVDDARQDLNVTVNSAFALGWGRTLLTNFQVDGLGSSGKPVVYLDDLTIYRW